MSDYETEDLNPDEALISGAYQSVWDSEGAAATARTIAENAAAQTVAAFQPLVEERLSALEQERANAVAAEAVEAMQNTYGAEWEQNKDAVAKFIEDRELISDVVLGDPQKLAEVLQSAHLATRQQTKEALDAEAWEAVKKADASGYVDRSFR